MVHLPVARVPDAYLPGAAIIGWRSCEPTGYSGSAGACGCDTGYTGTVSYEATGPPANCVSSWIQQTMQGAIDPVGVPETCVNAYDIAAAGGSFTLPGRTESTCATLIAHASWAQPNDLAELSCANLNIPLGDLTGLCDAFCGICTATPAPPCQTCFGQNDNGGWGSTCEYVAYMSEDWSGGMVLAGATLVGANYQQRGQFCYGSSSEPGLYGLAAGGCYPAGYYWMGGTWVGGNYRCTQCDTCTGPEPYCVDTEVPTGCTGMYLFPLGSLPSSPTDQPPIPTYLA